MIKFANGGVISGPALALRLERIGIDAKGHCLYRINGGDPEHIVSAAKIKSGDTSELTCPLREVQA